MTDETRVWGLGLEQSRERPGVWLIEGYDVIREASRWEVRRDGQRVHVSRTLAGAREWIAEQRRQTDDH